MSLVALQNALTGLAATQRSMELTSRNVANASTPGYTKKVLTQESAFIAGQAMGVETGDIQRNVDESLQKSLWTQTGTASSYETLKKYLERLQQLQGTTDGTTNISSVISKLENGFSELSASPSDGIIQTKVVNLARNVSRTFNQYSQTLQSLRNDIQSEMKDVTTKINAKLDQISKYNVEILAIRARGQSSADLEDKRDQAIQELSENIEISTFKTGDGAVAVQTKAGGVLLADTATYPLTFNPATLSYSSYYPSSAEEVSVGITDITALGVGGKLGSLIKLRDEILPQQQAQMDELAHKMATRFDAQGLTLFVDSSTNTVPADVVANYVGISARLTVNDDVINDPALLQSGTTGAPPNPGSNSVIMKILNYTFGLYSDGSGTANTAFRTTGLGPGANLTSNMPSTATLADYGQGLIGSQAEYYSNIENQVTFEEDYRQTLEKNYLDQSGVSIDNEMANMITLQKAYAANAKVFSAVDGMYQALLEAVRA